MELSILLVEPDVSRGKQVTHLLIQAGYDVLVASYVDQALPLLYESQPNAVILSSQLPAADMDRLSDAITTMSDLPIIELTDGFSLVLVAQRLTRSTGTTELVETLAELFGTMPLEQVNERMSE